MSDQLTSQAKLQKLPNIPFNILSPTILFANGKVYSFGGYAVHKDGSKKISAQVFCFSIGKARWYHLQKLPVSLVNATAILSHQDGRIYLFGGVSEEVDLSGQELNYFVYDIASNRWTFNVNLAIKSPFVNSRYIKPRIVSVAQNIFISYTKQKHRIDFKLFELARGGVNLRYSCEEAPPDNPDEKDKQPLDDRNLPDLLASDYDKTMQDEMSLIVQKSTIYAFDEPGKYLFKIDFSDIYKAHCEKISCFVADTKKNRKSADNEDEDANDANEADEQLQRIQPPEQIGSDQELPNTRLKQ